MGLELDVSTSGKQFQVCNGGPFLTLEQGRPTVWGQTKNFKDRQGCLGLLLSHTARTRREPGPPLPPVLQCSKSLLLALPSAMPIKGKLEIVSL